MDGLLKNACVNVPTRPWKNERVLAIAIAIFVHKPLADSEESESASIALEWGTV
jgi:hypothetical protein